MKKLSLRNIIWLVLGSLGLLAAIDSFTSGRHMKGFLIISTFVLMCIGVYLSTPKKKSLVTMFSDDVGENIARVYVNDVEVGSIPASHYLMISDSVRSDRNVHLIQVRNICVTAWRLVMESVCQVPWVVAVIFMAGAVANPEAIVALIGEFQNRTPVEIAKAIQKLSIIGFVLALVSSGIYFALTGRDIKYRNAYDDEINRKVCAELEVPTEGIMKVAMRPVGGGHE